MLIVGVALLVIVGGGFYFVGKKMQGTTQIATDIARERLKILPRYNEWKKEGFEYQVVNVYPSYPENSSHYKPELWTVDFDIPNGPTDQGIEILVDINKKEAVNVFLHME